MDIKRKPTLLLTILLLFFLVYLTGSASIDDSVEIDDGCKMPWLNREDPNSLAKCTKCHLDPNTITSYLNADLRRSATATCMRGIEGIDDFGLEKGCHSDDPLHEEIYLGRSHPTDVKPKDDMDIPEDLHLDEYFYVTCVTCHDPHKDWISNRPWVSSTKEGSKISETEYRTYYLRRRDIASELNAGSDLCIACHTGK